jgi:hypothetical protein
MLNLWMIAMVADDGVLKGIGRPLFYHTTLRGVGTSLSPAVPRPRQVWKVTRCEGCGEVFHKKCARDFGAAITTTTTTTTTSGMGGGSTTTTESERPAALMGCPVCADRCARGLPPKPKSPRSRSPSPTRRLPRVREGCLILGLQIQMIS